MKRYEGDIKTNALARMQEVGVKQTGEELGISIQTLYKWRNEDKNSASAQADLSNAKMEEMIRLLKNDDALEAKLRQLEAENTELRKSLAQMRRAFVAMFE